MPAATAGGDFNTINHAILSAAVVFHLEKPTRQLLIFWPTANDSNFELMAKGYAGNDNDLAV